MPRFGKFNWCIWRATSRRICGGMKLYWAMKLFMMVTYLRKKRREVTARTRKGWNTKLDADKYKVQCLEAFCASLRSISAMNKSIRARRIKCRREKSRFHHGIALFFSFSLCLYIFFSVASSSRGCGCSAQRKEAACKMGRGMRDNRPIIVDRDDTWVLSQNYSRTVTRGRIQFGVASTLTGKKRDETKIARGSGAERAVEEEPTEAWFLSWFFEFADPCCWGDGNALRSLETTYLTYANASWFHRGIAGD